MNPQSFKALLQGITSDSYQLTVRQPGSYVIDMTSPIFDTYLVLRKDGQTVAEDDDSGGDMNARLAPGRIRWSGASLLPRCPLRH